MLPEIARLLHYAHQRAPRRSKNGEKKTRFQWSVAFCSSALPPPPSHLRTSRTLKDTLTHDVDVGVLDEGMKLLWENAQATLAAAPPPAPTTPAPAAPPAPSAPASKPAHTPTPSKKRKTPNPTLGHLPPPSTRLSTPSTQRLSASSDKMGTFDQEAEAKKRLPIVL